jgi:hypothetical protein
MQFLYRTGALLALVALLATSASAQQRIFFADLSGGNEVPAVETEASGLVRAILDGTTLVVSGTFQDLESDYNPAIGAHIHRGGPDENGPIAIGLNPRIAPDGRAGVFPRLANTFQISTGLADSIRTGLAYVNIHTVDNPGGELRGQLGTREEAGNPGRAFVQVIHNSPDPGAAVVDIYANGFLALDDVPFRAATPFVEAPSGRDITVAIAPSTSESAADAIYSETFNLPEGAYVQVVASGVLDPSMFAANPSGVSTAFDLIPYGDAMAASMADNRVVLRGIHGSPDAPTVDIRTDNRIRANDIDYTDGTGYLVSSPNVLDVQVTTADGTPVQSFVADLTELGGAAVTILASGFLTPEDDQNGPAFGLLAVTGDGTSFLLPVAGEEDATALAAAAPEASLTAGQTALGAPYPNPATSRATVDFELAEEGAARVVLYDALGREVAVAAEGNFQAGRHTAALETGALPSGVYVLRLTTGGETMTRRLTVAR